MVLDEPTSGLSPESLESLLEEVSSLLADPNVSLLILEQGADRAYLFGVPVRVMEHGRILAARDRPEDDALAERA